MHRKTMFDMRIDFEKSHDSYLLMAFDFDTTEQRDSSWKATIKRRLLCNRARDKTIRFRPNLNFSREEATEAIGVTENILAELDA